MSTTIKTPYTMSLNRSILRLMLPSVVSNITVPLLGLVDLGIVGHLGNDAQIGAIGIGTAGFNMLYWVFAFLRMGTTGLTGQAHGACDKSECATSLLRALLTGLLFAAVICLLQYPVLRIIEFIMRPSEAVLPYYEQYFRICIWGAPAILCNYALSGWFIGMQNTRIPMMVAIVQNVINIVMSLIFVLALGWGLKGVALGTLTGLYSGLILAGYCAMRLWHRERLPEPEVPTLFDTNRISQFATMNTDIFLRTLCLVSVMTFFTSAGSRQNDNILAANTILMQFFLIFSFFIDGLGNAAEALSGEYHGAGNSLMLRRSVRYLFLWAIFLASSFTLLFIVGGEPLLRILTNQEEVILTAYHYIPWVWMTPLVSVLAFVWDGIFIGLCWSRGMLFSMFIAACIFFLTYFCCFDTMQNTALWLAFVCYLGTRGVLQTILWFSPRFKK